MFVKKNRYTEYVKTGTGQFICYSYQLGTMVVVTDPKIIDSIEKLNDKENIEIDEKNDIWQKLIYENIVLPIETDELIMANYCFQQFFIKKNILQLTIIVTRNCNFSCPYCPQEHEKKNMSDSIFKSLLLLIENVGRNHLYSKIVLSWFGGEPLLMYSRIVDFCVNANMIAQKYNLEMIYGMTTNGYMLNKDFASTLFDLGILNYQITLDGTIESHDRFRTLKNGNGTWQTIWKNLNDIKTLPHSFDIGIRINCSPDILFNSEQLIAKIASELDQRFSVIPYSRNAMGENPNPSIRYCTKFESALIKYTLFEKAIEKGVSCLHPFKYLRPFSRICTSNDPDYFVLDYDGKLKKCEAVLDFDNNDVGFLSSDGKLIINHQKHANWVLKKEKDKCYSCHKYPLCYGFDCREKLLNRGINDEICPDDFGLETEYIRTFALNYIKNNE